MTVTQVSPARRSTHPRPVLVAAVVLALVLLALTSFPARESLYRDVVGATTGSAFAPLVSFVAELGLLGLVAAAGVLAVVTWLGDRPAFGTLVAAGGGTVLAYLASEVVKLVVTEDRPCRTLDVPTVLACPAVGDWSWPSNHAVLAAAFAAACVLAVRRSGWFVVPLAGLVALSRVAGGVHYAHDVLSGLALGILVVALTTAALRPLLARWARRS
jgi:undecaprenyl-diphosphatase